MATIEVVRRVNGERMHYRRDLADDAIPAEVLAERATPGDLLFMRTIGSPGFGITPGAAKRRVKVTLPDGRVARLVSVPTDDERCRRTGTKARVQLPSQAILSFTPEELAIMREWSAAERFDG